VEIKVLMIYKDLADEEEDERIRQIGEKTMGERLVVGFVTDDEPGKAERYVSKLQERFPGIRVVYQGEGPVMRTVLVKVAPPVN
jgi:hypothetical protein